MSACPAPVFSMHNALLFTSNRMLTRRAASVRAQGAQQLIERDGPQTRPNNNLPQLIAIFCFFNAEYHFTSSHYTSSAKNLPDPHIEMEVGARQIERGGWGRRPSRVLEQPNRALQCKCCAVCWTAHQAWPRPAPCYRPVPGDHLGPSALIHGVASSPCR